MDSPPFPAAAIAAAREAAKAHLRIAGASEDALIDGLAATALALAERFTGTVLILGSMSVERGVGVVCRSRSPAYD